MIELILEGRIVQGHPMARQPTTKDNAAGVAEPVIDQATGLQATETFFAMAIPKNGVIDWKSTPWGQQIASQGAQGWPKGESNAPTFAWKIQDGDSTIPNKRGKVPNTRDGWSGHWIVSLSTRLFVKSYHVGKYDPTQQIQNENEIKCGDYGRVLVGVKGNAPSPSPGVYINPLMFELQRAGEMIVGEGTSAADAFGGGAATQPNMQQQQAGPNMQQQQAGPNMQQQQTRPNMQQQTGPNMQQQTGPNMGNTVQQAGPDFLNGPQTQPQVEVKYLDDNGNAWTEAEMRGAGATDEMLAGMRRA